MKVTFPGPGRQFGTLRDDGQPEQDYLRGMGEVATVLRGCEPDFLVISASKTGTTWLSQNLSSHPDIFIPRIKELHYFNRYWKRLDVNWYLEHFRGHERQKKGEATPYAGLPLYVIKIIARMFPRLKLIFLMREPIQRAWSHAKHDFRYCHGIFSDSSGDFARIPERKFIEHFTNFHAINIGDYLQCLGRWLSCFDRRQIFVGFYESIETEPCELLRRIFDHLGVEYGIDLSTFPVFERILPGIEWPIPPGLKTYLDAIYVDKAKQLSAFLKKRLTLETPPAWADTLAADALCPIMMKDDYKGYSLLLHRGKFYALSEAQRAKCALDQNELERCDARRECFTGHSLDEVKYYVDRQIHEPDRERYVAQCHLANVDSLFARPVVFIEHFLGFDIFLYRERFHLLESSPGNDSARQFDEHVFRKYVESGEHMVAPNVEEARRQIESCMPNLVLEGFQNYNIVLFRRKYFVLAQLLGPVDLARLDAQRLQQLEMSGYAAVADTFEDAKIRASQMADQRSRHV